MQRDKWLAGEFSGMITVEMTYIVPVILLIFFLSIMGIFYFHDKEVIAACAYEAAVVGSAKAREKDGVTEGTVKAIFEERVNGKCILFGEVSGSAEVSEERIVVKASASRGRMRLFVSETASLTEPEETIRKYRKLGLGR
ncbi:MAG: pilus assembly protein [Dorea sp.]|nr:pilus assembly protein [Dorea sp.]